MSAQTAGEQARLIMEAVAVLHARGYGLLKLYCYVKEGLGAWRHWIFASDAFPTNIWHWPGMAAHGSLPGHALFDGSTPEDVADSMLREAPQVLDAARGQDATYVNWYREMLLAYPSDVLVMESPSTAEMFRHGPVPVPQLKAWEWVPPVLSPEEIKAQEEAARQQMMQMARERWARRHKHQK